MNALRFFLSITTYPSQHSHLCYSFFACVVSNWTSFFSIGHSWSNRCLVKYLLQSCLYMLIKRHSRSKYPFRPSNSYPIFDIPPNLSILTNYRVGILWSCIPQITYGLNMKSILLLKLLNHESWLCKMNAWTTFLFVLFRGPSWDGRVH